MKIRLLSQLFSFRDIRNALLGTIVVMIGIALSLLTVYAHQINDPQLAGIAAGISLIFVLLILVFVVPPLAKSASREASQMNLPFEFTTGGAVMIVLLAVVGFSAWNTGNNLLFLILSFLAASLIVGFFAGRISLKKLDVKMRFPETIFAGERTPILVSLTNRKYLFPSMSVVVEVRGKERDSSIATDEIHAILPAFIARRMSRPPTIRRTLDHIIYVPRRSSIESSAEHVFGYRGRFLIKDFELSTRFPFGFFRHRRRLPARETELIVFPSPEPFEEISDAPPLEIGRTSANKRGLGQDLLALRDYRHNDDFRHIDWKATARSQTLTVREFASDDDQRITVIVDTAMPAEDVGKLSLREKVMAEQNGTHLVASERFEHGVGIAASIFDHFAELDAEIRLVIGEEDSGYGVSRSHLYEILKRLAVAEPKPAENGTELEDTIRRIQIEDNESHLYLVTAGLSSRNTSGSGDRLRYIGF